MCVFRLLYNKILTSTTVTIECISWLINVIHVSGNLFAPVNVE